MKKKRPLREFTCIGCGTTVQKHCLKTVKYCSQNCFYKHRPPNKIKTGENKTCMHCNKIFYVPLNRIKAITCSVPCSNAWQGRDKVTMECKICKKAFNVSPSTLIYDNRKYCSIICRNADPENIQRLISMNANQSKANPNKFEKLAYSIFISSNIEYIPQYIVNNKFTVDAFIPTKNIVIQFDGDYWHANPSEYTVLDKRQQKRKNLDLSQDSYMEKIGLKVYRFWQSEFKNLDHIKASFKKYLVTP